MLESYVRDAPKRYELYQRNVEVRRYACREYGDSCGEWFVSQALNQNGHVLPNGSAGAQIKREEEEKSPGWKTAAPAGGTR